MVLHDLSVNNTTISDPGRRHRGLGPRRHCRRRHLLSHGLGEGEGEGGDASRAPVRDQFQPGGAAGGGG